MQGIVKWFNKEKGFGFITGEDNEEYFVHNSEVVEGNFLDENDEVIFEPVDSDKGKQATGVSLVKKKVEEKEKIKEKPQETPKEDLSTQQGPGNVMNL